MSNGHRDRHGPGRIPQWTSAVVLGMALAACGGSEPLHDPAALCVNSACGQPELLVDLPQLENLLPTSTGRLFVTGQDNLYEIHRGNDGSYSAQSLLETGSGCGGITEFRGWIYALCTGNAGDGVYALELDSPTPVAQFIYSPTGMSLPNGLVADADGALYLTDGPVASEPKIVRLRLDPNDPRMILSQETWLLTAPQYPNGLALRGASLFTTLYLPDSAEGTVARIEIQPDGSAGSVATLATRGIMDDLNLYGDTLLVTDWQNGAIFQIALDGTLLQETVPGSFSQPSSVDVMGPPLFDEPTLLVTERYSGNGVWRLAPK